MTANGWFQIGFYLLVIFLLTKPVGIFMTRVFNRKKTFLDPVLRPIERIIYRLTGVDENHEMRWTEYAIAMLLFSGVSMALLYLLFAKLVPIISVWELKVGAEPAVRPVTSEEIDEAQGLWRTRP